MMISPSKCSAARVIHCGYWSGWERGPDGQHQTCGASLGCGLGGIDDAGVVVEDVLEHLVWGPARPGLDE